MPPKLHRLHPKSLLATTTSRHSNTLIPPLVSSADRPSYLSPPLTTNRAAAHHQRFSSLNSPTPLYPGHVPINLPERLILALGSTLYSFLSPTRPDMIALCSETTTPTSLLRALRDTMLLSTTGRQILRDRPRISTSTVSVPALRQLPEGTLGRTYAAWLDMEHVTPDTRDPVRHVPEAELAYVLQRYRESHDLYHVLLAEKGMPVFLESEVIVKAFEFAALGLPMTGLAALSAFKLPAAQRRRVLWGGKGGAGDTRSILVDDTSPASSPSSPTTTTTQGNEGKPWILYALSQGLNTRSSSVGSLLNVYWEKEWETPMTELRARLGITLPEGVGDLRAIRKAARMAKKQKQQKTMEGQGHGQGQRQKESA